MQSHTAVIQIKAVFEKCNIQYSE